MSTQRIQAPTGGVSIVWRQAGASDGVSTLLSKRGHKLTVGTGGYGKETWAYGATGGGATDLVVQDSAHGHTVDAVVLAVQSFLAVAEALHGQEAENVTLGAGPTLAVDDATHGHSVDSVTLTLDSTVAVQDALHAHQADEVTLDLGSVTLAVADTYHAHTVDNVGDAPARASTGGGFAKRRAYLINGRKRWLTDAELAVVVANELLPKSEVKTVKNGKIKPVPQEVWKEVTSMVESIQRLDPPDDEDEDEEMMLLYA